MDENDIEEKRSWGGNVDIRAEIAVVNSVITDRPVSTNRWYSTSAEVDRSPP